VLLVVSGCSSTGPTPPCPANLAYDFASGQEANPTTEIIVKTDCQHHTRRFTAPADHEFYHPTLSPDGKTVAFVDRYPDTGPDLYGKPVPGPLEVYSGDLRTGQLNRLTYGASAMYPVYSPDGTRIAFSWMDSYLNAVFVVTPAAGADWHNATLNRVASTASNVLVWSSDGKTLYKEALLADREGMAITDPERFSEKPWFTVSGTISRAFFSPDGKFLLMVYAPSANASNQLWARDIHTGRMIQLTHLSNYMVDAGIASDWTVYYTSTWIDNPAAPNTALHSLNLESGKDRLLTRIPGSHIPVIAVQRSGPIGARPKVFG
jgi:Tol biopolymer transport system component